MWWTKDATCSGYPIRSIMLASLCRAAVRESSDIQGSVCRVVEKASFMVSTIMSTSSTRDLLASMVLCLTYMAVTTWVDRGKFQHGATHWTENILCLFEALLPPPGLVARLARVELGDQPPGQVVPHHLHGCCGGRVLLHQHG